LLPTYAPFNLAAYRAKKRWVKMALTWVAAGSAGFEAPKVRSYLPNCLLAQHEGPQEKEHPKRHGDDGRYECYP
jgi:hypothetical protein